MPLLPRCVVCVEVRVAGIECLDRRANTDSPIDVISTSRRGHPQSQLTAAPPAIVPSSIGLISMTFFTVWDAIQLPAVARESVATMMPPLNRKASVVVPCAILIGQCGLE